MQRTTKFTTFAIALGLTVALSACSGDRVARNAPLDLEQFSAEEIFKSGQAMLAGTKKKNAADAALRFSEVERLYPYSEWAERSVIMSAFAFHRAKEYEQSRSAAQRYLDFYPASGDAAYAQYLIALSFYDQIDEVSRDQGITFQALQALRTTIERYPDSEYASASLLKFDLALDHLAGKEMEIGRYYLKRGNFGAAINRFRVVVEDFQTTTHTAEALHRLVESYLSLGLLDEAQTAGAILGHNYKATDWYQDSYVLLTGQGISTEKADPKATGWLASIYRQVIKGEWL
jgi:outer membrane protein assembly factor BamD